MKPIGPKANVLRALGGFIGGGVVLVLLFVGMIASRSPRTSAALPANRKLALGYATHPNVPGHSEARSAAASPRSASAVAPAPARHARQSPHRRSPSRSAVSGLSALNSGPVTDPGPAIPCADDAPAAGMVVAIDPQTHQFVAPTPEQLRALGLVPETAGTDPYQGLEVLRLPDGSRRIYVGDRLMENIVVRRDASGRLRLDCLSNEEDVRKLMRSQPITQSAPAEK